MSTNPEAKSVAAVECPRCHAAPGQPCYIHGVSGLTERGAPQCHAERKAAWRESKRAAGLAGPDPIPQPSPCPKCGTACPSRKKAKAHCAA